MAELRISWREAVIPGDVAAVREIVLSSGFFNPAEVDIAVELVEERLARGEASGYFFIFAESGGRVMGYTCYGPISGTAGSFDLYWIAVHEEFRHLGLGRMLMAESEARIAAMGGLQVYAETSSRTQYEPTRAFYENCGYEVEAVVRDFYAPGDSKVIFVKRIPSR